MSNPKIDYDVVVIGAGAAGLFSAFTAARRGKSVLVLEKSNKVGKKILMSGGGKCNFTNLYVEPENFVCRNPHFVKSALSQFTQWDFIRMVMEHNIEYEERSHGQLFCIHSSKQILQMLLDECEKENVTIQTHCDVEAVISCRVNNGSSGFQISYQHRQKQIQPIQCTSVVIATGALSIPTLGGSGFGYEVAQQFGLELVERQAGLVPFMFSDKTKEICERLSGLALEVTISCHQHSFTENMLFTHRGISGPSVLQISNYWKPGDEVHIDLLPGIDATEWLIGLKKSNGKSQLKNLLTLKLAKPLVKELQTLYWHEYSEKPVAEFNDKALRKIGGILNNWIVKPSATEGYRTAEVTLGGVNTDGVSSRTMELTNHPGLFFIGEVLDVTGHLGGFNFQWAWSSGFVAGSNV